RARLRHPHGGSRHVSSLAKSPFLGLCRKFGEKKKRFAEMTLTGVQLPSTTISNTCFLEATLATGYPGCFVFNPPKNHTNLPNPSSIRKTTSAPPALSVLAAAHHLGEFDGHLGRHAAHGAPAAQ